MQACGRGLVHTCVGLVSHIAAHEASCPLHLSRAASRAVYVCQINALFLHGLQKYAKIPHGPLRVEVRVVQGPISRDVA
jgi:hypothetical protein